METAWHHWNHTIRELRRGSAYLICHLRFVKGLPEESTRIVLGYGGGCVGAEIRQQPEYWNYLPGTGRTLWIKTTLIILFIASLCNMLLIIAGVE